MGPQCISMARTDGSRTTRTFQWNVRTSTFKQLMPLTAPWHRAGSRGELRACWKMTAARCCFHEDNCLQRLRPLEKLRRCLVETERGPWKGHRGVHHRFASCQKPWLSALKRGAWKMRKGDDAWVSKVARPPLSSDNTSSRAIAIRSCLGSVSKAISKSLVLNSNQYHTVISRNVKEWKNVLLCDTIRRNWWVRLVDWWSQLRRLIWLSIATCLSRTVPAFLTHLHFCVLRGTFRGVCCCFVFEVCIFSQMNSHWLMTLF